ncbi:MAG: DNA integrity scanning protein DisA [Candidatus Diapherotrites archaeon ADurb.Bin253]|jgi:DNA integrity scanning protein DisA with diadenylate cyclase activity|nr:MAG: DNA integrity scanning protein DisA [Candidatus Diapherotrites archaeon ADurb.Bin253]HNZ52410.1 DNA integrity scanning protein DisA nucleotide-binding domain protein [Candidatus Pacearchaeota archaeon]HOF44369.1 DNA integrity scanning protein DisA nucleotide-binding domain protein [Candidatus Pacearchaeota archaeon]HOH04429.1 DNA integrity scanning protein DisA nucleotide-binding domain protein [Candidatus Pacearchaeota archaeon]HOR52342.1 DNA integrity scanning protein DisA nucleotide-
MKAKKGKTSNKNKKLEEVLIQVGLRIAKRGEGALFVVGETKYTPLIDQSVPPFKASNNPKLLESLALMDGAVIINKKGFVIAYGVRIKTTKIFKNFGTRHSAAISAATGDNIVVIVSEEDKKVRVMKKGKTVMQIDALQKNVEKDVSKAVKVLETIGAGTVGAVGTSILFPPLGVAILPGIVIFGSAYYLGKLIQKKIGK